jgi:hypothetical protein
METAYLTFLRVGCAKEEIKERQRMELGKFAEIGKGQICTQRIFAAKMDHFT